MFEREFEAIPAPTKTNPSQNCLLVKLLSNFRFHQVNLEKATNRLLLPKQPRKLL